MRTILVSAMLAMFLIACAPAVPPAAGTQTPGPVSGPTLAPTLTNPMDTPTPSAVPEPATASDTPTAASQSGGSTSAADPVTGMVQIAGGSCCLGGYDGDTIQAQVSFSAASAQGRVTQMRVATACPVDANLDGAAWEPFVDSKMYPVQVVINWSGFYVCAQYQDEHGNLSPVYRDDISVEGMPRPPLVDSTDWYPQIQCFSEAEVHPGPGETVSGPAVTFRWPGTNQLPQGVFYKVFAYSQSDKFASLAASGQTTGTSITLPMAPERAGQMAWYLILVDANGTDLNHGRCSSFAASLLTVDPPSGLKAIFFQYQP